MVVDLKKKVFIEEARELIEELERSLLELEENPSDDEQINRVFRVMHTLKGSSGIGGFKVISGETVASYIHPGNRLATVVGFSGSVDSGVGRDVAMQAAAMAPVAVDQSQIPEDLIAKEKEIARDLAIQEGKPAELADKIAVGRLNKWYKEVTLVNQPFIKDNKQTVAQYVASTCPGAKVESFSRIALG